MFACSKGFIIGRVRPASLGSMRVKDGMMRSEGMASGSQSCGGAEQHMLWVQMSMLPLLASGPAGFSTAIAITVPALKRFIGTVAI